MNLNIRIKKELTVTLKNNIKILMIFSNNNQIYGTE